MRSKGNFLKQIFAENANLISQANLQKCYLQLTKINRHSSVHLSKKILKYRALKIYVFDTKAKVSVEMKERKTTSQPPSNPLF